MFSLELSYCGGDAICNGVVLVSPQFLWSAWTQSLRWRADRQELWSGLASFTFCFLNSVPSDFQSCLLFLAMNPLANFRFIALVPLLHMYLCMLLSLMSWRPSPSRNVSTSFVFLVGLSIGQLKSPLSKSFSRAGTTLIAYDRLSIMSTAVHSGF